MMHLKLTDGDRVVIDTDVVAVVTGIFLANQDGKGNVYLYGSLDKVGKLAFAVFEKSAEAYAEALRKSK